MNVNVTSRSRPSRHVRRAARGRRQAVLEALGGDPDVDSCAVTVSMPTVTGHVGSRTTGSLRPSTRPQRSPGPEPEPE